MTPSLAFFGPADPAPTGSAESSAHSRESAGTMAGAPVAERA
jgi:hypothetical protein